MLGPILTTGVALSAAVVVVANPVTAPQSDVRIPAAQSQISKAGGEAVDMLDEDFIRAVGPGPTGSTNPFAVLKDLVSGLVADAADLGKGAILRAFVAGANAVSGQQVPELTAASYPYVPPVAPGMLPWTALPGPVPAGLRPVVEQALTAIIVDSGDLTDVGVVTAAFAAGAALAAEVSPVLQSLQGLVDGQIRSVLTTAGSALSAIPHPVVGDAITDAVERYLPSVPSFTDIRVLPRHDPISENAGLPVSGETAAAGEAAVTSRRQALPNTARRGPHLLAGPGGVQAPVAETVPTKQPLSALAKLGAAGGVGQHRPSAPTVGDGTRGRIANAIKAAVDRPRN